jgi:hypothetical protein
MMSGGSTAIREVRSEPSNYLKVFNRITHNSVTPLSATLLRSDSNMLAIDYAKTECNDMLTNDLYNVNVHNWQSGLDKEEGHSPNTMERVPLDTSPDPTPLSSRDGTPSLFISLATHLYRQPVTSKPRDVTDAQYDFTATADSHSPEKHVEAWK